MKARTNRLGVRLVPVLAIASLVCRRLLARRCFGRIALAGFAALALFGAGTDSAQAQTTDVILHSFAGASDGNFPIAGLIQASEGNLYGTTNQGGSAGVGTVYELSKDSSGNFTVFRLLHTFTGGATDGESPQTGSLLQAADGNLYGTTTNGGSSTGSSSCPSGCGTVYELSKDSNGNFTVFTLLRSFTSSTTDGGTPYAGLIQASDGNLYGTTTAGGTINFGTVYELSKDGNGNFTVFTLLRSFTSSATDGQIPYAGLIQASDGNLYGATYGGGSAADGTAYELSKDGNGNFTVFTLLHSFTGNATDGGRPQYASLIQASDGNLYGITDQGGSVNFGVAYELSKDVSGNFTVFTVLHSFNLGATDGGLPYGALVQASDGNLYGTASLGGSNSNSGVAYELSKDISGNFTVFTLSHSFGASGDGANVHAGLIEASDGNLYGTTAQGGSQDEGTVYSLQTGFSFSLSASPNSVAVTQGGAAGTSTITVNPTNGFTGSVTMTASGLPAGVSAAFSANPTMSTSTLSLTASATATTGTVTVTVTGTSGSLSNSTTVSLTVNGSATTTTLQSTPNPSTFGFSVTFTATVTSSTTGTPTGTVTFLDGAATLGTGILNGSAQATFATSSLIVGNHSITASYSGDSSFASSVSSPFVQTVAGDPLPVTTMPASLAFGAQLIGTTSAAQTVTLQNNLRTTLTISAITITGSAADNYKLTNPCGGHLAAGAFCMLTVTFTPSAVGARNAAIKLTDSAASSPQTVPISGTGLGPVSLDPMPAAFGVSLGGEGMVTLTNNQPTNLTISSISITGADSKDFLIVSADTTCSVGILGGQQQCFVAINFVPPLTAKLGSAFHATLQVVDNAESSPQTDPITAIYGLQTFSVSPRSLDFGKQAQGTLSAPQMVTVINLGSMTVSGPDSADFLLFPLPSCDFGGGTCLVSVTFRPAALGTRTATLTIGCSIFCIEGGGSPPINVSLKGTGVIPVAVTPASLTFTSQVVGTTSEAKIATIKNNLSAVLDIENITISGPNAGDFSSVTTCGSALNVGATCSISVKFTPSIAGPESATLTIGDNNVNFPYGYISGTYQQSVSLSGTGK